MRLIPAMDLRGGRCVRLRQGDFAAESVFDVEPAALLDRYYAWGAGWTHIVDLDAARDGSTVNDSLIGALVADRKMRLQVGGGLRSRAAVEQVLGRGASRAVIGSLAVAQPQDARDLLADFGPDRLAIAFDVRIDHRGTPCVTTHAWREQSTISLWEAVETLANGRLRHVLCTDVTRDGMLNGPNLELYADALRRFPEIEWQASGGIRDASDLAALAGLGVAAAVSGRALLEDRIAIEELRPFLQSE
ncbi:MAG TPA: 1-(5-phosphoribosyl)-5-[(5-phosphoribosylamino)methylideneamino] imidazole-4-carboxamide isomerase [Steroidobacteraceae bacterium]|nr:1-(5-phosphoribosyl)-5-[(5-phosphoribosylamino)methylideneamino] imidazole-4-carboxamide isomerase [Steroidobacteraceae bacterium]